MLFYNDDCIFLCLFLKCSVSIIIYFKNKEMLLDHFLKNYIYTSVNMSA